MDTVWLAEDEWQAVEAALRPVEEAFGARTVLPLCKPQHASTNQGPKFAHVTTSLKQIGTDNDLGPATHTNPHGRQVFSADTSILASNHPSSVALPVEEDVVEKNELPLSGSKKQRLLPTWAVNGCRDERGERSHL